MNLSYALTSYILHRRQGTSLSQSSVSLPYALLSCAHYVYFLYAMSAISHRVGMYISAVMTKVRSAAAGLLRACSPRISSPIHDSYFFGSMAVRLSPNPLCYDDTLVAFSARIFSSAASSPYSR